MLKKMEASWKLIEERAAQKARSKAPARDISTSHAESKPSSPQPGPSGLQTQTAISNDNEADFETQQAVAFISKSFTFS